MFTLLLILHSILFEIVHNLSFSDNCVYSNDLKTKPFVLDICPFISKSDRPAVKSSPHNPWIEGSNPAGKYTSFLVSRRLNPFSSENCSFCTLKSLYKTMKTIERRRLLTINPNINVFSHNSLKYLQERKISLFSE